MRRCLRSEPRAARRRDPGRRPTQHVAAREHDLDPALARRLGDDVDRRRLQLDEEDVGVDAVQLVAQRRAVGEVAGDVDDVGAVLVPRCAAKSRAPTRRRREERDLARRRSAAAGRGRSVVAIDGRRQREPRRAAPPSPFPAPPSSGRRGRRRGAGTRSGSRSRRPGPARGVDDEDPARRRRPAGSRRRCRRRATRSGSSSTASRAPSRTFEIETAPASPPPQRRQPTVVDAGERRRLEVVGRRVAAGARELEQRRRASAATSTTSGSGGPPRPIATTTTLAVAREQPRGVRRDRRLADPLAGADDPDRRQRERLERGRVEAEVGADVRQPGRERRGSRAGSARAGRAPARRRGRRRPPAGARRAPRRGRPRRHAVVGSPRSFSVPPTTCAATNSYGSSCERIAHDRRVVLAVDEGEGARITSAS